MRRGFRLKTLTIALVEAGILILVILVGLYLRFAPNHTRILLNQRGIYKVASLSSSASWCSISSISTTSRRLAPAVS